jgi:MFS family permease
VVKQRDDGIFHRAQVRYVTKLRFMVGLAQRTIEMIGSAGSPPVQISMGVLAARDALRRWWVLAAVVAAQFMFVVDAFIVNVALPTIAVDLCASAAQIEAVIAVYLIGYATLVITGGRLGDIYGAKRVFVLGILSFTLASLWCGLAQSGPELIIARLAQGATAALMVPQVLATIHVLFSDASRARAFAIYGVVLGLGGAAGFLGGGALVWLDVAGLGWRSVFFVNVPIGLAITAAALGFMPHVPRRAGVQLDVVGAGMLFAGLLCLVGPLLFGREFHWGPWVWTPMLLGVGIVVGFLRLERAVAQKGGLPLVDLTLLSDRAFVRGLVAAFCFFFANLSFYLIITLFLQNGLGLNPLDASYAVLPLALAFVVAARQSAARVAKIGLKVLTDGCALQLAGLAGTVALVTVVGKPSLWLLMLPLAVFGYGQGFVMAPLPGAVLSSVPKSNAGSASGLYGTVQQIANAVGVAVVGALFFALNAAGSEGIALSVSLALLAAAILTCVALVARMQRTRTA